MNTLTNPETIFFPSFKFTAHDLPAQPVPNIYVSNKLFIDRFHQEQTAHNFTFNLGNYFTLSEFIVKVPDSTTRQFHSKRWVWKDNSYQLCRTLILPKNEFYNLEDDEYMMISGALLKFLIANRRPVRQLFYNIAKHQDLKPDPLLSQSWHYEREPKFISMIHTESEIFLRIFVTPEKYRQIMEYGFNNKVDNFPPSTHKVPVNLPFAWIKKIVLHD